jgi:hypothetical protein
MDPESHPCTDVGHRGSNKRACRTFCVDCNTLVDSVPQEIHSGTKQVLDAASAVSLKETELLARDEADYHP